MEVGVVVVQTRRLELLRLAFAQEAERRAGLEAQPLDRAPPLHHLFDIFLLGAPPGGTHAKTRGPVLLRRTCRCEHRLERNERLVFDPSAVARRLGTVGAIFRAPSSLDREQRGELHRVGVEVQAMHALGAMQEIVERELEERLDGFASPTVRATAVNRGAALSLLGDRVAYLYGTI